METIDRLVEEVSQLTENECRRLLINSESIHPDYVTLKEGYIAFTDEGDIEFYDAQLQAWQKVVDFIKIVDKLAVLPINLEKKVEELKTMIIKTTTQEQFIKGCKAYLIVLGSGPLSVIENVDYITVVLYNGNTRKITELKDLLEIYYLSR